MRPNYNSVLDLPVRKTANRSLGGALSQMLVLFRDVKH